MKVIKTTSGRCTAKTLALVMVLGAGLAACGEAPAGRNPALGRDPPRTAAYVDPPKILRLIPGEAGVVVLGAAAPQARVRLATPEGEEVLTEAGEDGAWTLNLPPSGQARIFGLSMISEARTVQAEGYQLILPDGRLVRLRAGAGAVVVGGGAEPVLNAFDFDEDGGAVVSGRAPPEASFTVRIDGRPVTTNGRADAEGRFSLPFGAPVPPGPHRIEIQGEGFGLAAAIDATPGPAPARGAFQLTPTPYGPRIDWLTPGGGVQSTLLIEPAA